MTRMLARIISRARVPLAQMGPVRMLTSTAVTHGFKMFDRLIPEDDPELKKKKELESQAIERRMARSKLAEMMTANKEKLYISPPDLLPLDSAPLFPDVEAVNLGRADVPLQFPRAFSSKATLVTLAFQAIGQKQEKMWHDGFLSHFAPAGLNTLVSSPSQPGFVNLLYLEGWFFNALRNVFIKSVAKELPPSLSEHSAILFGSGQAADHFCERLNIHNRVMCHIFLVDNQGRVRWRAHSEPADGEIESMLKATRSLMLQ